jgi:hypothetical protein
MTPRRPTTRQSPKTPKGKKILVREASSPVVSIELDFTPKVERVIKISHKKPSIPPPLYRDTDTNMTTKVPMPSCLELYNNIHHDQFPEFTPHNDPKVRVLDGQVFQNIKLSSLYMVASRTPTFPCIETLEWIIDHTKVEKCVIIDVADQFVGDFLPVEVNKYYKLREPEVRLNTNFMVKFYEKHNTNHLLASWWEEDRKFLNRASMWYTTINLREPYTFLMVVICQLYGKKYVSKFLEAWIPLAYTIAIS